MYNPLYLSISLIAALFVFMLDYGLGQPADDHVGYGSFLFSWSFRLARRRMIAAKLYSSIYGQYLEQLSNAHDALQKHRIKRSFRELIFTQGREMFTWEKAVGMCPYCTHFWVNTFFFSLVNIFYQKENIIIFGLYFLLSHLFIRIFKKL